MDFTYTKLFDNPVCAYLQQFEYDDIAKLFKNGIISKDTIDFIFTYKSKEFFKDENNIKHIGIAEEFEPNYWEKLLYGIRNYQKKLA